MLSYFKVSTLNISISTALAAKTNMREQHFTTAALFIEWKRPSVLYLIGPTSYCHTTQVVAAAALAAI